MRSGLLKYRIKIYKLKENTSQYGSKSIEHEYDRDIYANVKYLKGGKIETNSELFNNLVLEVSTRIHNKIELTDWLEIEGVKYEIDRPPLIDKLNNKQTFTIKLLNE